MAANLSLHPTLPSTPPSKHLASHLSLSHNFHNLLQSSSCSSTSSSSTSPSTMVTGKIITTVSGAIGRPIILSTGNGKINGQIFAKRLTTSSSGHSSSTGQTVATLTPIISNGSTLTTTGGKITIQPIKSIPATVTAAASSASSGNNNNPNNVLIYNIKADSSDPSRKSSTVLLSSDGKLLGSMGSVKFLTASMAVKNGGGGQSGQGHGQTNSGTVLLNSGTTTIPPLKSCSPKPTPQVATASSPPAKKIKLEPSLADSIMTPLGHSGSNKPTTTLAETTNDQVNCELSSKSEMVASTGPISKSNIENVLPSSGSNTTNSTNTNKSTSWSCSRSRYSLSTSISPYHLPDEIFDTDDEDLYEEESYKTTFNFNSSLFSTTTNVSSTPLVSLGPSLGLGSGSCLNSTSTSTTITSAASAAPNNQDHNLYAKIDIKEEPVDEVLMLDQDKVTDLAIKTEDQSEVESESLVDQKPVVEADEEKVDLKKLAEVKAQKPVKSKRNSSGTSAKNSPTSSSSSSSATKKLSKEALKAKRATIWRGLLQEVLERKDRLDVFRKEALAKRKCLATACEVKVKSQELNKAIAKAKEEQPPALLPVPAAKPQAIAVQGQQPKKPSRPSKVVIVPNNPTPKSTPTSTTPKTVVTPTLVMVKRKSPPILNGGALQVQRKSRDHHHLTTVVNGTSGSGGAAQRMWALTMTPEQVRNLLASGGKITVPPKMLNGAKIISGPILAKKVLNGGGSGTGSTKSRTIVQQGITL